MMAIKTKYGWMYPLNEVWLWVIAYSLIFFLTGILVGVYFVGRSG